MNQNGGKCANAHNNNNNVPTGTNNHSINQNRKSQSVSSLLIDLPAKYELTDSQVQAALHDPRKRCPFGNVNTFRGGSSYLSKPHPAPSTSSANGRFTPLPQTGSIDDDGGSPIEFGKGPKSTVFVTETTPPQLHHLQSHSQPVSPVQIEDKGPQIGSNHSIDFKLNLSPDRHQNDHTSLTIAPLSTSRSSNGNKGSTQQIIIPPLFPPYAFIPTSHTNQNLGLYRLAQDWEVHQYQRMHYFDGGNLVDGGSVRAESDSGCSPSIAPRNHIREHPSGVGIDDNGIIAQNGVNSNGLTATVSVPLGIVTTTSQDSRNDDNGDVSGVGVGIIGGEVKNDEDLVQIAQNLGDLSLNSQRFVGIVRSNNPHNHSNGSQQTRTQTPSDLPTVRLIGLEEAFWF